ncbi:tyrosine kinase [Paramuricea clavata]|uniref:Tyrosine kinase n=1 Tax=Paramuricea clavata TaxID=317549 RepID=A0A6S7HJU1_PARCT|nr:tyrosine kinase [Paramuricea clavata]
MAPEILVKSCCLKSASLDDLKKVDVWALGMVMFNLVNPDLKQPFQLDLVRDASAIEQVEEFLRLGKQSSGSNKYKTLQETTWLPIAKVHRNCTVVDPIKRPAALEVLQIFQSLVCSKIEENVAAGRNEDCEEEEDGSLNGR